MNEMVNYYRCQVLMCLKNVYLLLKLFNNLVTNDTFIYYRNKNVEVLNKFYRE